MSEPVVCETKCNCLSETHATKLVVITGGPGAGKTAILEMAKKVLCQHVAILPEAASIVFGGGFWRLESKSAKLSAQKAIYHIQKEMENLVLGESKWAIGLCDRGTLDGLAYWPNDPQSFWEMSKTNLNEEYSRYAAVIHLRSPSASLGYNHQNPLRVESASEAQVIDEKIASVWRQHPNYKSIASTSDFISKVTLALTEIAHALPECCREAIHKFNGSNNA